MRDLTCVQKGLLRGRRGAGQGVGREGRVWQGEWRSEKREREGESQRGARDTGEVDREEEMGEREHGRGWRGEDLVKEDQGSGRRVKG